MCKRTSLIWIFGLLALAACGSAWADFYRWTDSEGQTHFGSSPPNGDDAKDVELVRESELPALVPAPAFKVKEPSETKIKTEDAPQNAYKTVKVSYPENDSSIRENAGNVAISVQIEPALNVSAGHVLAYFMDGREISVGTSTSIQIPNVDRGTHTIQVKVISARGKEITASPVNEFTLQRYSKLFSK